MIYKLSDDFKRLKLILFKIVRKHSKVGVWENSRPSEDKDYTPFAHTPTMTELEFYANDELPDGGNKS